MSTAEHAAADVVHVVGVAVVAGAHRDDGLQRRRAARGDLQAVEAAPGDAEHADRAAAPRLRGQPGDDLDRVLLLLGQVLVLDDPVGVAACRAGRRARPRSRGRRSRGGGGSRAARRRRPCGRAGTRGWRAPDRCSASSGSQIARPAACRRPAGSTCGRCAGRRGGSRCGRPRRRTGYGRPMSTRLTYTSGELGSETDEEFEARLAAARAAGGGEPLPHAHLRRPRRGRRARSSACDPCTDDAVASRAFAAPPEIVARARRRRSRGRRAVAPDAVGRALRAAARGRRRDRRAPPRARRGRQPGDRQVAHRVDPRGAGGDRPHHDLRRPHGGQRRLRRAARQLRGRRAQHRRAAPLRRLRRHRALQLPGRAVGRHGRLRADRRQHGGVQALRGDAVDRARSSAEIVARRRAPARRLQPRARRRGDRPRPGRRAASTASPSPARPRSGARSPARCRTGPYARPALTEMGGKNPAIVTAHADLDKAAEGVARAAFGLAGQKCSACSRAIVVGDVHDAFVERLAAWTARLPLGDPADRASFVGPGGQRGRRRALRGRGRHRAPRRRGRRRRRAPRAARALRRADRRLRPARSAIRWSATSSSSPSSP